MPALILPDFDELTTALPRHLSAVEHLHRSKHADTYAAEDERTGGWRAVKRLRNDRLNDAGARRRLFAEAEALRRSQHRNVVHLYAVETCSDGAPALVMELVRGCTLRDEFARERRLPHNRVADIGAQLAAALGHMHDQHLVHGDVKPANVMLEGERVVLIDLHLSRQPGSIRSHIGTRGFTAPEVVRCEWLGRAADAWGLGVVLHRALHGTLPTANADWWRGAVPHDGGVARVIHELLAPIPERRLGCRQAALRLRALTQPPQRLQQT